MNKLLQVRVDYIGGISKIGFTRQIGSTFKTKEYRARDSIIVRLFTALGKQAKKKTIGAFEVFSF